MAIQNSETMVRELLEPIGVQINGKEPWDIQVHDPRFYDRVLREAQLGLGEAYMDGWWDCQAIDELIYQVLKGGLDARVKGNWKILLQAARARFINLQSTSKAFEVG